LSFRCHPFSLSLSLSLPLSLSLMRLFFSLSFLSVSVGGPLTNIVNIRTTVLHTALLRNHSLAELDISSCALSDVSAERIADIIEVGFRLSVCR